MPKYYTRDEVVKEPFLFISYSHNDKVFVHKTVTDLIGEGVRLWYDADLHNGDKWIDTAREVIKNENCVGTIFFNSPSSYLSDPVAEERVLSLQKIEEFEKAGKVFSIFVINKGKPSTLRLLKKTFEELEDSDSAINCKLSTEKLQVILKLFDDTVIYSHASDNDDNAFFNSFLEDMIKRAPDVVNKSVIVLEEMEKLSQNTGVTFKMGTFPIEGETVSLEWQFTATEEENGVFILKQILDDRLGKDLILWLRNDFMNTAFTKQEQELIKSIRLLSFKETESLSDKIMSCNRQWWLSDIASGSKQMVVRDDGTVYTAGSINHKVQRGVRPVITVNMKTARDLMR